MSSEWLLFSKSSFFRTFISSLQLFSQISYFFETKLLRAPNSWKWQIFRAVSFRNTYLFGGENVQSKDIQKRATFSKQVATSAQHQIFQKSYLLETANFTEKQYSTLPIFCGELPFQSGYFFKKAYFPQQLPFEKSYSFITYFFKRDTISQLRFLSTATLDIYQLIIK